MIYGPNQRRYRVLWTDLAGDLYAHDRSTIMAAIREAMSLHKSTVAWRDIRIHDRKANVMWSLRDVSPPVSAKPKRSVSERIRRSGETSGSGA